MPKDVGDEGGFRISAQQVDPDIVLVAIAGELDVVTVLQTTTFLTQATAVTPRHLILDLSGVTFLTSSGIGMLIAAGDDPIHGQLHLLGVTDNRPVQRPLASAGSSTASTSPLTWTPCSPGCTPSNRQPSDRPHAVGSVDPVARRRSG
jgi:anti-anti-sigma factor